MATIRVTTNSGLNSALQSAASGDQIQLVGGHFTLSTRNYTKAVTITSDGSAVIDKLQIAKSANLTIDGVDFNAADGVEKPFIVQSSNNITIRNSDMEGVASGYGEGRGLHAGQNVGFTFENNKMHGFSTGAFLVGSDDIVFRNNTLSNIKWDGMIVGQIDGGRFVGNTIDMNSTPGLKHSDGMQFWNTGNNNPSSGLVIEDNVIRTHNAQSHGIYMANAVANSTHSASAFFDNVRISDNIVVNAHGFGIAWGQTAGLTISDNVILRDVDALPASVRGRVPHILVHEESTNVTITGNVTHMQPWATDANWQPTNRAEPTWTIANNTIVPVGTTVNDLPDPPDPDPDPDPTDPGNGRPDIFRFDSTGPTDVVSGLDFSEGDVIELFGYKGGTFHAQRGGNELIVTINGAVIDSVADLRELDTASDAVHILQGTNDTLVMDIDQPAGVHTIQILNFAHEYF